MKKVVRVKSKDKKGQVKETNIYYIINDNTIQFLTVNKFYYKKSIIISLVELILDNRPNDGELEEPINNWYASRTGIINGEGTFIMPWKEAIELYERLTGEKVNEKV